MNWCGYIKLSQQFSLFMENRIKYLFIPLIIDTNVRRFPRVPTTLTVIIFARKYGT